MRSPGPPRRSARARTRDTSRSASATASPGTDPREYSRTALPPGSSASAVWGHRLRTNTPRFRPAHMTVAVSRSTWCRRASHPPSRSPPYPSGPAREAAATPPSRTVRPRSAPGAAFLTPGPHACSTATKRRPSARRAQKPKQQTSLTPIDKPFHMRITARSRRSGRPADCEVGMPVRGRSAEIRVLFGVLL